MTDSKRDLYGELNHFLNTQQKKLDVENETLFAHFYIGEEKKSGAIRLTSSIYNDRKSDKDGSSNYFSRHNRVFGRNATLLTWMAKWADTYHKDAKNIVFRLRKGSGGPLSFDCNRDKTPQETILQYNVKLSEKLCPKYLAKEYFKSLREPGFFGIDDKKYRELFIANRGKSLDYIHNEENTEDLDKLASVLGDAATEDFPDVRRILFLGAIQSVLVFCYSPQEEQHENINITCYLARTSLPLQRNKSSGQSSKGVPSPSADRPQNNASDPFSVLVRIPTKRTVNNQKELVLLDDQSEHVNNMFCHLHFFEKQFLNSYELCNWAGDLHCPFEQSRRKVLLPKIEDQLRNHFTGDEIIEWRTILIVWMATVIQSLRGEIHESKRLSFFLVAGDRSLVEDSPRFHLSLLDKDTTKSVSIPDRTRLKNDNLQDFINQASTAIGKLNYPWFQEGRYALFWDITNPQPEPIGLLEVENSTWKRWEETMTRKWEALCGNDSNGQNTAEKIRRKSSFPPPLILAYCNNDGSSCLTIGHQRLVIANRRDKHWDLLARQERINWLANEILPFHGGKENPTNRTFAGILTEIAQDKTRGCILVFLQRKKKPPGLSMGRVWEPSPPLEVTKEHEEDLKALFSMDGATYVERGELRG